MKVTWAVRSVAVIAEAHDGHSAVRLARELRPDIVLMDIRMPGLDGLEAARRVLADAPDGTIRVLMLTTFDLNEYVYEALRIGASGLLLKDVPAEHLAAGIRTVARGEALLAPSITRRLIEEFTRPQPAAPDPHAGSTNSRHARSRSSSSWPTACRMPKSQIGWSSANRQSRRMSRAYS